jgi:predicted nucleotidyltransferase
VLIDGIKVEVQGTEPFAPADLDGLTDKQILYVGAHRYALESATAVTLVAQAERARATVPLATPGALVAMKLHAIEDRRAGGGLDKRAATPGTCIESSSTSTAPPTCAMS